MYIHRIVIDANRINANHREEAMNLLEALHEVGAVEILGTSTLRSDLFTDERRKAKASRYRTIRGSGFAPLRKGGPMESMPGDSGKDSRIDEIYRVIFGEFGRLDGDARDRATRDALHLDQCWRHGVDFFVTNDHALIEAREDLSAIGIDIKICIDQDCLNEVHSYFDRHYHTRVPEDLAVKMREGGPIILGSTTIGPFKITDPQTEETLLAIDYQEALFRIHATLYDEAGRQIVQISPASSFQFGDHRGQVTMIKMKSHLLVGENTAESFSVSKDGVRSLMIRLARDGHIIVHEAFLRNSEGNVLALIRGDFLELTGASLALLNEPLIFKE